MPPPPIAPPPQQFYPDLGSLLPAMRELRAGQGETAQFLEGSFKDVHTRMTTLETKLGNLQKTVADLDKHVKQLNTADSVRAAAQVASSRPCA